MSARLNLGDDNFTERIGLGVSHDHSTTFFGKCPSVQERACDSPHFLIHPEANLVKKSDNIEFKTLL
jgi:hypothetical protein